VSQSGKEEVCIVGVGDTEYSRASGVSEQLLAIRAVLACLRDAEVPAERVDTLIPFIGGVSAEDLIAGLGLPAVATVAALPMGGAACVGSIKLAAQLLRGGDADYVLAFIGRNGSSGARVGQRARRSQPSKLRTQLEHPHGWSTPAQWYAMMCRRHMAEFGTTKDQLASVALSMRAHAQRNPRAQMHGRTLTRAEYHAAPYIADPYQKFDCCLESDGGAAILLTRGELASGARRVVVAGYGEGHPDSPDDLVGRADWLRIGLTDAAERAYAMAGAGPADMDAAMIYDCFTFEVLHQLEEAGFCARGDSGPLAEQGALAPGGRLPVNTHGGLLSEGHMIGINHVIEAVRQLRGECGDRQLPAARWIAATGWGDLGDGTMAILRRAAA
jgi:acetyl-CoA acetyltransferase